MELNEKQLQGLDLAVARYRAGEKCTIIAGYAGTGKSTLVKFIIAALEDYGINPDEDVVYTSFTGKATQVLQKRVIKMLVHYINYYLNQFQDLMVLSSGCLLHLLIIK